MKRRTFLQQAGVLLTSATTVAAAQAEEPQGRPGTPDGHRPTILLTAAETGLGRALAASLGTGYHIRTVGEPLFRDETGRLDRLFDGVNAIVHAAQPDEDTNGSERLDRQVRGTYDLLTVAAPKGVELVVYLSSLQIMAGYDPVFQVAEDWRPVPTSDAGQLAHYLAECVCREFAREGKLRAVVLRLGEVLRGDAVRGRAGDLPWVDQADAVEAVRLALEGHFAGGAGLRTWNVLHVAADVPGGRFPVTRAKRVLGYRPQFGPPA